MSQFTDVMRLIFRLALSCTLMIEAMVGLMPEVQSAYVPVVVTGIEDAFYQNIAFAFLYFIISIWLLFGIKTNITAALGGILLVLPAMVVQSIGSEDLAIKLAIAAVLALPLAVFGGGRYAVHDRADWEEAF